MLYFCMILLLASVSLYSMDDGPQPAYVAIDDKELQNHEDEILIGQHTLTMPWHLHHAQVHRKQEGRCASFDRGNTPFGKSEVYDYAVVDGTIQFKLRRYHAYALPKTDIPRLVDGSWAYVPRTREHAGALIIGSSKRERTAVVDAFKAYRTQEETTEHTAFLAAKNAAREKGWVHYWCCFVCCAKS